MHFLNPDNPPCRGITTDALVDVLPTWQQPLLDHSTYLPATDLYVEHSDAEGSECGTGDVSSSGDESDESDEVLWKCVGM
jgi:hypothetical protein